MSTRGEQKRQAKERREAAEREAASAAARRRRVWQALAVAVLAVAVAIPVVLLAGGGDGRRDEPALTGAPIPAQRTTDLEDAVRAAGAERISHPYAEGINEHTPEPVEYATNPPTNGPHAPVWTQDGMYAGLAAPPTEEVVHAQEHGRIVFQYRRGLPEAQLRQLVSLYEESPDHVLLVENATSMPCDVAATAWGHGLRCPRLTDRSFDALRAFRDAYRDKGPEPVA